MTIMRRWAVRNAGLLERAYRALERAMRLLGPVARRIGRERIEPPLAFVERATKRFLFDCRMCGQCALSVTGMSCPMNCPKGLRNGPCGGVRADGTCEVDADMRCVWVEGWRGSQRMSAGPLSALPNPPVEANLAGKSSWIRVIDGGRQPVPAPAPASPPREPVSRLQALLRSGEFVVTAEFSPPDSADPAHVYERLAPFDGCVDAVNVTDGSGANCHLSSLGTALLLQQAGCEPVMQIACRDRNRIAIQADILGAAALGIRNLLCITGDHVSNGDHPGAKPVFDLDAVTLLQAARALRDQGQYLSGRAVSGRPRLFLGGADNPFVPPHDFRLRRLAKKIAAGAQFAQTQYCFDIALLDKYMAQVRSEGLHERCHIIVGVGPLASARTALWMRSRVPGVWIPDHVIQRLDGAKDAREEGLRLCVELIGQIREIRGVAGIHLMAHRQEQFLAHIVDGAGLFSSRRALFDSRGASGDKTRPAARELAVRAG